MLVKKIDPEWKPKENENLEVGDVIDITDPLWLLREGKVAPASPEAEALVGTDPGLKNKALEAELAEKTKKLEEFELKEKVEKEKVVVPTVPAKVKEPKTGKKAEKGDDKFDPTPIDNSSDSDAKA